MELVDPESKVTLSPHLMGRNVPGSSGSAPALCMSGAVFGVLTRQFHYVPIRIPEHFSKLGINTF